MLTAHLTIALLLPALPVTSLKHSSSNPFHINTSLQEEAVYTFLIDDGGEREGVREKRVVGERDPNM